MKPSLSRREDMTIKLLIQATTKLLLGILLVGILIFLPAGTFFANGVLLMATLFLPMFLTGIVMMFKNPDLLKKRLNAREEQQEQRMVVKLSGLTFILGFIVAGFTIRFHWYILPRSIIGIAVGFFLVGYLLYWEVLRENTYLSRTIEIQENQMVIDTGLYSIVRHPMYSATLFLFLSMPLILGSIYAFLIFLAYPFIIVKRIKREEEFLEKELDGYGAYKEKVKYRLIPLIW